MPSKRLFTTHIHTSNKADTRSLIFSRAPYRFNTSAYQVAYVMGMASLGIFLPTVANAVTPAVTNDQPATNLSNAASPLPLNAGQPDTLPLNVAISNTLAPSIIEQERSIEQQKIWQDAIKQQRIESLRQAQPSDNSTPLIDEPVEPIDPDSDDAINDADIADDAPNVPSTPNVVNPPSCLNVKRIELGELPKLGQSVKAKLRRQANEISVTNQLSAKDATITANLYEYRQLGQNDSSGLERQASLENQGCILVDDANQLIRSITDAYLDAGYFKTSIKPTAIDADTMLWQVHIATVTAIDNQTQLSTPRLFGSTVGKPANMATLDQAVSNGERVIDGQLLLDIYPTGENEDDVRIKITQDGEIDTFSTDMEWRYDPTDSGYGHNQLKLRGTVRNALGQADLTTISVQQSLTNKYGYDDDNQRRNASVYTSIPSGKWQWSGLLAADEYSRTTQLPNSTLEQTGDSWQANLRGDYTFKRDQDSISTLYGQLSHQDVNSELLGERIEVQSPKLSGARVGISHTKLFNKKFLSNPGKVVSGAWVVDLSAEQGVGNHDNEATKQGLSDDYLRWLLSAYVSHRHPITSVSGKDSGAWQVIHELQGQYSEDQLFGVNQQSLGSTYSGVRGLDNAYSAAESGVTLRNTLSYDPAFSNWVTLGNQKLRWSPYIGADYGVVKQTNTPLEDDTSEAASGTLGIKVTGYGVENNALDKRWQLDVSASRARVDYPIANFDGTQDAEISGAFQWFF